MFGTRAVGCTHGYLEEDTQEFSSLALGMLARAIGQGLKVAYIDMEGTASRLTNFLENLSLSYTFVKQFDRLRIDTFTFKSNGKVSRTIIPLVEFHMLPEDMFWQLRDFYDLVIFDRCSGNRFSYYQVRDIISQRHQNTEMVFVYHDRETFEDARNAFDLVTELSFRKNTSLTARRVFSLQGEGKGKTSYGYGYLLRHFLAKHDVKLISFDKGGEYHGEMVFFHALKRWCQENTLYGRFDYVVTGMNRFDGRQFRTENIPEDIREAREGLMLLQTALKKQTPVMADELSSMVVRSLLSEDEVLSVLDGGEHELVITGTTPEKNVEERCSRILEFKQYRHYHDDEVGIRRGIEF